MMFFSSTTVSEEDLERLKQTFKTRSGNAALLPKSTFTSDVLSSLVPARLAEVRRFKILKCNEIYKRIILFQQKYIFRFPHKFY